jgi:hypothetical protein
MSSLWDRKAMSSQLSLISRAILGAKITIVLALLMPLGALGQTPERNLSGMVKSASGYPIPNAQVSVKNLANGS